MFVGRTNIDIIFKKYVMLSKLQMEEKKEIQKEVLKPITKVKSKEDKELQELEVESTGGGMGAGGAKTSIYLDIRLRLNSAILL